MYTLIHKQLKPDDIIQMIMKLKCVSGSSTTEYNWMVKEINDTQLIFCNL